MRRKLINFLHPDRPMWTWMPTLKGPLRPLWPLYKRWSWWREEHDFEMPKGLYYRTYWWLRDRIDALFVREILKRMQGERCLYVHPNERSPAAYVIVKPDMLEWHPSDHTHVEGRS